MKRLLALAFIWGWSFLFIKVAVEGMTPTTVAGLRVGLGLAVLLVALRARGTTIPRRPALWGHFTVAAVFGSALPFTLLAWGEQRITSALTAVVNASTPLFTAVAVVLVLGERLRPAQVGGLLLGLGGVAVAAGVGGDDLAGSSVTGVAASAGAGACYGFSFAWSRRHLMAIPPLAAAAGQLTVATVLMAPFAIATSLADGIRLTPSRVTSILLLGMVGTGVAYVLNFRVIAELGATRASLVTYVIPVVAVAVGILVLDEPFHLRILAGGLMIVLGIAVVHGRLLGGRRVPAIPSSVATAVALLVLLVAGCGGDDDDSARDTTSSAPPSSISSTTSTTAPPACDAPSEEPIDPSSAVHVLPGSPEPEYTSDPPTSGPHQPVGGDLDPVLTQPLRRPRQVGLLEAGKVLVQYEPDVTGNNRAQLESLAGDEVVVAPNPALPAPVVATAWGAKLTCSSVDLAALEDFGERHAGEVPGH